LQRGWYYRGQFGEQFSAAAYELGITKPAQKPPPIAIASASSVVNIKGGRSQPRRRM
jgi:hypothetical protein